MNIRDWIEKLFQPKKQEFLNPLVAQWQGDQDPYGYIATDKARLASQQAQQQPQVQLASAPTPTPEPNTYPIPQEAVGIPDNPGHPGFSNQTRNIEPGLFDAISGADTTDFIKRLMFALGAGESSGGYNLTGDSGNAHGPFHINQLYRGDVPGQRNPISIEDSMDPNTAVEYLLAEILRNQAAGSEDKDLLSSWNSKSGYVNDGPRYNEELPLMATTSAFLRGK